MVSNLRDFGARWAEGGSVLFAVGAVLLALAVWLAVEAAICLWRFRREGKVRTSMEVPLV
jgi:hypothetical protein